MRPSALHTVGHSNRSLGELVHLLQAREVTTLADIRTVPRSRHAAQFNREELEQVLPRVGICYNHIKALGGFRRGLGGQSPNTAWRNGNFRGFADYMLTGEFEEGLEELLHLAGESATAIMCAEAVPWRCHRSLIADALTIRGVEVTHILGPDRCQRHRLTPFAEVRGRLITYPQGAETGREEDIQRAS